MTLGDKKLNGLDRSKIWPLVTEQNGFFEFVSLFMSFCQLIPCSVPVKQVVISFELPCFSD